MWPPSRNLLEVDLWISNGSAACESSLARNPLPVCTVNPLSGDEWLCDPRRGWLSDGAKSFGNGHERRPPGSRENRGGGARPPTSLPEIEEAA